LAYSLLDAVVDNYFIVLEQLGERIEALEDRLLDQPEPSVLQELHGLRGQIIVLRRSVWPLREVVSTLKRNETDLVTESTGIYLRDLYDHIVHVIDTVETLREMLSGMLEVYLSSVNYRMSEVMKVLTMIATVFIPLTFIVGIYGMNFEHMPELRWAWAYPVLLMMMLAVAGLMFAYFRRKRWI
jgi:magnesium transporter